jgi:coniferyl-aldehyde dehydrogenase
MRLAHQEIFGPILPIFGYRTIDDAIDYVNARPRPLALYYFGENGPERREVLDRTTSGNVTISAPSCSSRRTTCPSAAASASAPAPAAWANTTASTASAPSAIPQASTPRTLERHPPAARAFTKRTDTLLDFFLR